MLEFQNDSDTIQDASADYFCGTVLADETDPDKLHDLQAELDGARVYTEEQVKDVARRFVEGEDRDRLDPVLGACVAVHKEDLDEGGQVGFEGNAKGFVRTYGFLSRVFNEHFGDIPWEDADRVRQLITEAIPSRVAGARLFRYVWNLTRVLDGRG